jgi:hypothetical protein
MRRSVSMSPATVGPGDPCTAPEGGTSGIDDCGPGWFCWEVAVDDQGYCVALCTGSIEAPACEVGYQCAFFGDAPLCLIRCDPLMQICLGETCLPYEDGFICVGDESGDAGQANDPCAVFNACDPGLVCLPPETASSACDLQAFGCCQPYCQLPDGTCPNPDQQCLPWYDPMMPIAPGYEDVGYLLPPELTMRRLATIVVTTLALACGPAPAGCQIREDESP